MSKKSSYVRLGKLLKDSRTSAGLTQQFVAEKLGYGTAQFISNWERGFSTPPLQHIKTIVKLYKMDRDELLRVLLDVQKELLNDQFRLRKERLTRLFAAVR